MAYTDQGEFEAMKTPIGRRAPHCDKDHFHAKMTVNCLRDIIRVERLKAEQRIRKMALS